MENCINHTLSTNILRPWLVQKKIALNFIIVKNLKICIAVLLNVGSIMEKAKKPDVSNGLPC